MNRERLEEYLSTLTEEQYADLIKKTAQELCKLLKRKNNALKSELDTSAYCSRAKRTTLYANAFKISEQYNKQVEFLKEIVLRL
jgi:hypothetical protein